MRRKADPSWYYIQYFSQEWYMHVEQNPALVKEIKEQESEILELRGRLGLNSTNSSRPPLSARM